MTEMTPHSIYKDIGSLIKARRKTLGLKQEKLSGALGISRGSLANIETGRQSILVHQLYHFAKALELSPADLLPLQTTEAAKIESTDWPLPNGLKAEQKEQIAKFLSNATTTNSVKSGGDNAKSGRR